MTQLLRMLYHLYPRVRKTVSEKLYIFLISLLSYDELFSEEEDYNQILNILTQTNWTLKLNVRFSSYLTNFLDDQRHEDGSIWIIWNTNA